MYRLPFRRSVKQAAERVRFMGASYEDRLEWDALPDPYYGYCIYNAAKEAERIGYDRISVVEFGVASGHGLISIEWHVEQIRKLIPIEIEIYGFDLGKGLPAPSDPRDLPYLWFEGDFQMDYDALRKRLNSTKLVLGNVSETVPSFFEEHSAAPLGCVFIDLDFYTSTLAALRIFDAGPDNYLPRVPCHLDDVIGRLGFPMNEHVGELAAIARFNELNETKKIGQINGLHHKRRKPAKWNDRIFIFQDFEHPRYNAPIRAPQPWKKRLNAEATTGHQ